MVRALDLSRPQKSSKGLAVASRISNAWKGVGAGGGGSPLTAAQTSVGNEYNARCCGSRFSITEAIWVHSVTVASGETDSSLKRFVITNSAFTAYLAETAWSNFPLTMTLDDPVELLEPVLLEPGEYGVGGEKDESSGGVRWRTTWSASSGFDGVAAPSSDPYVYAVWDSNSGSSLLNPPRAQADQYIGFRLFGTSA